MQEIFDNFFHLRSILLKKNIYLALYILYSIVGANDDFLINLQEF